MQKFGLGLVTKFSFRGYTVEAKGSVLTPCNKFVYFWSFRVLLRESAVFFCSICSGPECHISNMLIQAVV
jgi:hypothetical protein